MTKENEMEFIMRIYNQTGTDKPFVSADPEYNISVSCGYLYELSMTVNKLLAITNDEEIRLRKVRLHNEILLQLVESLQQSIDNYVKNKDN